MQETLLVTGASGFIGRHLVETLSAAGQRVRACVRYDGRADAGWLRELPAELHERTQIVAIEQGAAPVVRLRHPATSRDYSA